MLPSTCGICASIVRLSSTNRTSPCLTRAPSSNFTAVISLSTRGLIATLAIVVTVPSASRRIGTDFLTTVATVTGTARWSPRDACAAAFCDGDPVQKNTAIPARASPAATPTTKRSFLHAFCRPDLTVGVPHSLMPPRRRRTRPYPPLLARSCTTSGRRLARPSGRPEHPAREFCAKSFWAFEKSGMLVNVARPKARRNTPPQP